MDLIRATVCLDQAGGAAPGERINACTKILSQKGLSKPEQGSALINRAWSYGLNKRWNEAAADYDLAIKLEPGSPVPLNEKGLMRLKMGLNDQAIQNYGRALALNPRLAFSLYGRGLARLRKGDTGGEADLAAARSVNPDVDAVFTRIGVTK